MIARVIVAGQEHYYDNVIRVRSDMTGLGGYLHLHLASHSTLVHFWRGPGSRTSVLLAADGEAFTAALREEMGGQ